MALQWNGDAVKAEIKAESFAGITRTVVAFQADLQDELNVSAKVGRGTSGKDYEPAPKGSPPRKRTGWLQQNVAFDLNPEQGRASVGVRKNAIYGIFLELKNHPWLLATFNKFINKYRALLKSRD